MTEHQEIIASPCVRNCCLNEQSICVGCLRTLDEICSWAQADATIRRQILLNCAERRTAIMAPQHVNNPAQTASDADASVGNT